MIRNSKIPSIINPMFLIVGGGEVVINLSFILAQETTGTAPSTVSVWLIELSSFCPLVILNWSAGITLGSQYKSLNFERLFLILKLKYKICYHWIIFWPYNSKNSYLSFKKA